MTIRPAHLRNLDLYERALAGNFPAGIERYSPEAGRLIARGRVALAVNQARLARGRAAQLKGLPIGADCARWAERELQEVRNARRDHSHFIGTSRKLAAQMRAAAVPALAAE